MSEDNHDIMDELDFSEEEFWEEENNRQIIVSNLEESWQEGLHVTQEGDEIKIKDMSISHLKNTIKYFDGYDTSPLEKELSKRSKKK